MPVPPEQWWSRLRPAARDWLTEHNGEPLAGPVVAELEEVGEQPAGSAWWAGRPGPDGLEPSDAFVDWVDAVANGESPADPSS